MKTRKILASLIAWVMALGTLPAMVQAVDEEITAYRYGTTAANVVEAYEFDDGTQFPTSAFGTMPSYEEVDGLGTAKFDTQTANTNVGFYQKWIKDYVDGTNKYLVLETKYKEARALTYPVNMFGGNYNLMIKNGLVESNGFAVRNLALDNWHTVVFVMDISGATVNGSNTEGIQPYKLIVDGESYDLSDKAAIKQSSQWVYINNDTNSSVDGIVNLDYYRVYIPNEQDIKAEEPEESEEPRYTVATNIESYEFNNSNDFPTAQWNLPAYELLDGLGTAKFDPVTVGGNVGFNQAKINGYISNKYLVLETKYKVTKEQNKRMYLFGTQCMGIENTDLHVNGTKITDLALNTWHTVVYVVDLSNATVNASNQVTGIQPYKIIVDDEIYDLSDQNTFTQNVQWNYIEPNNGNGVVNLDYFKVYIPNEADVKAEEPVEEIEETVYTVNTYFDNYDFSKTFPANAFGTMPTYETADGVAMAKFDPVTAGGNVGFYQKGLYQYKDSGYKYVVLETRVKTASELAVPMYLFGSKNGIQFHGSKVYANDVEIVNDLELDTWHTIVYVIDMSGITEQANYGAAQGLNAVKLIVDGQSYAIENGSFSQHTPWNFIESKKTEDDGTEISNGIVYMDYYRVYVPKTAEVDGTADIVTTFTDTEGNPIEEITAGTLNVKTTAPWLESGKMYVVLYNGGTLEAVKSAALENGELSTSLTIPQGEGYTVKVMLWNSNTVLKPVKEAVDFPSSN